jgi:hypothetical protein
MLPWKPKQMAEVRRALSSRTDKSGYWPFLQTQDRINIRPLSKKAANKFLLGCAIDYYQPASRAWDNAGRLAKEVFQDRSDLFDAISAFSESEWEKKRPRLKWLHPLRAAHRRVWRIARIVVDTYRGDVRNIWRGQKADTVKCRFLEIGLGEQISRMAVGALRDTGHVAGWADLKADLHVCRVLGRLLSGKALTPGEATEAARRISPQNPWRLDAFLYMHGKRICGAAPDCARCSLRSCCDYYRHIAGSGKGRRHRSNSRAAADPAR